MVSYKPLWHLLVQRDMSKRELMLMVGIAPNTMTKLRRNEEVSMTVLTKICKTLSHTATLWSTFQKTRRNNSFCPFYWSILVLL